MFKLLRPLFLLSVSALFIAGCSSVDLNKQDPNLSQNNNSSSNTVGLDGARFEGFTIADLMSKNIFNFEFNRYDVAMSDYPILKAHAAYLRSQPQMKVTIAGHTDDIGSSEFNLALGQKRSEAVKVILMSNGVLESQIEAVSFGKEKPIAVGNSEESRALNRRAHIIYP